MIARSQEVCDGTVESFRFKTVANFGAGKEARDPGWGRFFDLIQRHFVKTIYACAAGSV